MLLPLMLLLGVDTKWNKLIFHLDRNIAASAKVLFGRAVMRNANFNCHSPIKQKSCDERGCGVQFARSGNLINGTNASSEAGASCW